MSSTTKDKRIRRIERRGSPELVDAMRKGLISVRTADSLFYLPHDQQRVELQRRVDAAEGRERRSAIAARVIRTYLGATKAVDLQELQRKIRDAVLPSGTTQS